jgi:glycosyltransferase involved in cell wall biosynthesis
MSAPIVSVVMPSYNHAKYIGEAIASVLAQDFDDLELLVSDDASTDGAVDVARSFTDPRISVFASPVNRGAAVVHNELIDRARGKYIALINSDDAWSPDKLSAQVAFLDENRHIAACFGRAIFMDANSAPLAKGQVPFGPIFDAPNRSRGAWLRQFLAHMNCLCHPTVLMRSEVYRELGPYDLRLRQLPDFDMWVRLVKNHEFKIIDREIIRFRVLPGESASASTPANNMRMINELFLISRKFFDGVSPELLVEGFGDLLIHPRLASPAHVDIEKAALLLKIGSPYEKLYKIIGLAMLFDMLASPRHRDIMISEYFFSEIQLQSVAGQFASF